MPYNSSPYAPRARRDAVNAVLRQGLTKAEVARRTGVHRATIGRWIARAAALDLAWCANIPTLKPVPRHHPKALSKETVAAIVSERLSSGRCGQIVHLELLDKGIDVSLSSVHRTIKRAGLSKDMMKWKTRRPRVSRPLVSSPGDLVEVDTIHFSRSDGSKFYVYTMIDLYSRGAFAECSLKCDEEASLAFIQKGRDYLGITIAMLQADNGPEFLLELERQLLLLPEPIPMRHSRVKQSNDNAHIERFNRTLQTECTAKHFADETIVADRLIPYLIYYNHFRRHLGIGGGYPGDLLLRY